MAKDHGKSWSLWRGNLKKTELAPLDRSRLYTE